MSSKHFLMPRSAPGPAWVNSFSLAPSWSCRNMWAAVAPPGLVQRARERPVRQVVQGGVAAEDVADGAPGSDLAEGAEHGDLEQPIVIGPRPTCVRHNSGCLEVPAR